MARFRLERSLLLRWEEVIAVLSLVVVVGSVGFGIASRYIMTHAATWTVELATLSFTWAVFFGSAAAFRQNMHVNIDLLVNRMPTRLRMLTGWLIDLLLLGFLLFTLYVALKLTIGAGARPSPILRIPFSYVYGAVVVSFASMSIHQFMRILKSVKGGHNP